MGTFLSRSFGVARRSVYGCFSIGITKLSFSVLPSLRLDADSDSKVPTLLLLPVMVSSIFACSLCQDSQYLQTLIRRMSLSLTKIAFHILRDDFICLLDFNFIDMLPLVCQYPCHGLILQDGQKSVHQGLFIFWINNCRLKVYFKYH